MFLGDLAGLVVGQPVAPADRFLDPTRTFRLLGRQGLVGMALWDALGRAADRPVAELIGGAANRTPRGEVRWSVSSVQNRQAQAVAQGLLEDRPLPAPDAPRRRGRPPKLLRSAG